MHSARIRSLGLLALTVGLALVGGSPTSAEDADPSAHVKRRLAQWKHGPHGDLLFQEIPADPPAPAAGPKAVALCIGVDWLSENHYGRNPPNLQGAVWDAVEMAHLARAAGFHVTLMTDERATTGAVTKFLEQQAQALKAGDTLLVYFAGFGGLLEADTAAEATATGEARKVAAEAQGKADVAATEARRAAEKVKAAEKEATAARTAAKLAENEVLAAEKEFANATEPAKKEAAQARKKVAEAKKADADSRVSTNKTELRKAEVEQREKKAAADQAAGVATVARAAAQTAPKFAVCLADRQLLYVEQVELWKEFAPGVRIVLVTDASPKDKTPEAVRTAISQLNKDLSRLPAEWVEDNVWPAQLAAIEAATKDTGILEIDGQPTDLPMVGVRTLERADDLYRKRTAYRDVDRRAWKPTPVVATVVHLAAAPVGSRAVELNGRGLFTVALIEAWAGGIPEESYEQLVARARRMIPNQAPQYREAGAPNPAFVSRPAFTRK